MNWGGTYAGGTLPDGSRCWVAVGDSGFTVGAAEPHARAYPKVGGVAT